MYSIVKLLKKDKCYCYKKKEVIKLKNCEMFDCRNSKSCLTKSNNKYENRLYFADHWSCCGCLL